MDSSSSSLAPLLLFFFLHFRPSLSIVLPPAFAFAAKEISSNRKKKKNYVAKGLSINTYPILTKEAIQLSVLQLSSTPFKFLASNVRDS